MQCDLKMSRCGLFHTFMLYFLFSVILTYPLIFLNDGLVGPKEDNLNSYWGAWHFNKSIFNGNETLFFTKDLFYPSGASLLLHTLSPFNLSLEFIFSRIFSLSYSYNLVIFLSFLLSAYFTFLLCLYFTKDKWASFVGGMIFAFSPYHFAHALHHINFTTGTYFFPLLALFFFKLRDKPSIKYTLLLSLILLLIAFTDYYYLIYSFAFLFLGLIYFICFHRETDKKFFKYTLYSIIIAIIILSPLVVSTLLELKNKTHYLLGGLNDFVLDIFSFVTPTPWHPVFGGFAEKIYEHFTANPWESTGYLGFTTLFLSIFGWINNKERQKDKYFFILLFFITIILSLGSTLHVFGHDHISLKHPLIQSLRIDKILNFFGYYPKSLGIPLPYYFLAKIPIFNIARVASRWIVLSYLSLSIIGAFGLKKLLQKFSKEKKAFLYSIILGLIIFEYLAIPLEYTKLEVPSFYYTIAKDNSDYAIFDIPCITYVGRNYRNYVAGEEYMFLQTIHNKKLLFGVLSRPGEEMYEFLRSTGLFEFCESNYVTMLNKDVLKKSKIKYIVLHKEYLKQDEILFLTNRLNHDFDFNFEDKNIKIYKVY